MRRSLSAALALAVVPALALLPGVADAHGRHHPPPKAHTTVLTTEVLAPFGIDVRHQGRDILVADGFTSLVSKVNKDGSLTPAVPGEQPGVAGLARSRDGRTLAFTTTSETGTTLEIRGRHFSKSVDLSTYEQKNNPDGNVMYGVKNANQCVADFLNSMPDSAGAYYSGIVDSHPYAVESLGHGMWAVADAGGNDILIVDQRGHIRTLAVLPPQPHTVTAEEAARLQAPDCLIGVTYAFEAVPTDVELGPGGLYVTTLPGGPEGPILGARGSVYKVNLHNGRTHRVATGFAGATGLAVNGCTLYVAELFGGRVARVNRGHISTFVTLDSPLSLETAGRDLIVGTMAAMDEQGNVTAPGSIVRVSLRR